MPLISTIERQRKGDSAARVEIAEKGTELARLGYVFNTMADEIAQKTVSLTAALKLQTEMTAELDHRVKNTLANILSIARQSFKSGGNINEIEKVFIDRIMAIASAHSLLSNANWEAIDARDLARAILKPHQEVEPTRMRIAGPSVRLVPNMAVVLGMVLHELSTNAVKHGALSKSQGHVNVTWKIVDGHFTLTWKEAGGPAVTPPKRQSFGSRFKPVLDSHSSPH